MNSPKRDDGPVMKKEEVLPLIISQLSDYGYSNLATVVAKFTNIEMTAETSSTLARLLYLGSKYKEKIDSEIEAPASSVAAERHMEPANAGDNEDAISEDERDLDQLDIDGTKAHSGMVGGVPRAPPDFIMWYQTTHKGAASAAAFSRDGRYLATGSVDTTLKVIDTDRIKSPNEKNSIEEKPVVRTLYDHYEIINDLAFHPNGLVLASCSNDRSIKLFDLTVAQGKRSFRYIYDNMPVNAISFHPSGDFLAAATEAPELRIYDSRTFQCFIPPSVKGDDRVAVDVASSGVNHGHTKGLLQARYSHDGSMIATSSYDGTVRLWDGVSGECVRTIPNAHSGTPVNSVCFSRNRKYVLTGGKDSLVKLWEVGSGNMVHEFRGCTRKRTNCHAEFTHDEALVLSADEASSSIVCWDSRTGTLLQRYSSHGRAIAQLAVSPSTPAFVICSEDNRVRFYKPSAGFYQQPMP